MAVFVSTMAMLGAPIHSPALAVPASDGQLDPTLDGDGMLIEDTVFGATALAVQQDGRILIAGTQPAGGLGSDIYVARYLSNGAADSSFGSGGKSVVSLASGDGTEAAKDMAVDSQGRIVVVGYRHNVSDDNDAVVIRFSPTGVAETPVVLGLSDTQDDFATGVAIGSGDKIVVGGYAALPNYDSFAVRLTGTLALDTTGFGGGDGIVYSGIWDHDYARDMVTQSNGRIVVGGNAAGDSGTDSMLAGFTADGSVDTSFGTTSGHTFTEVDVNFDWIAALTVLDDDKIIAVGEACTGAENPTCDVSVLRYKSDGTLDSSFGSGGKKIIKVRSDLADEAWDATVQTDGKVVIVGIAADNAIGGEPDFVLIRLTPDGDLDSTFGSGGVVIKDDAMNYVGTSARIARQPDGRILIASSRIQKGVVIRFDARSSNARLTALVASPGTLSFSPLTSNYELTVPNSNTSLSVTATVHDPNALLKVRGLTATSGVSSSVPISVGATAIPVVVTSQDGSSTSIYTITVTRDIGTLKKGKSITAKAAMATVDKTIARGSTVKVVSSTATVCRASGQSIKGLKTGTCRVKISVTPKKTKAAPKPKATTTTVTIRVV